MKGSYDTPILPSPRIMNIAQGSIKECRNYIILPCTDITFIQNSFNNDTQNLRKQVSCRMHLTMK